MGMPAYSFQGKKIHPIRAVFHAIKNHSTSCFSCTFNKRKTIAIPRLLNPIPLSIQVLRI